MGDHRNPIMLTLLTYLLYLLTYFTYLPVPKRFFIASRCLKTRESRIRDRGSRIGSRIEDRESARIEDPAAGIEDGGSRRGSRIGDRDRSRIGSEDPGLRIGDGGSRTQNRGSGWRIVDRGFVLDARLVPLARRSRRSADFCTKNASKDYRKDGLTLLA